MKLRIAYLENHRIVLDEWFSGSFADAKEHSHAAVDAGTYHGAQILTESGEMMDNYPRVTKPLSPPA